MVREGYQERPQQKDSERSKMSVRTFEVRENEHLNYIECAGVRVPANWTIDQLRDALAKRNIRFSNEQDAIAAFGESIRLKAELERREDELTANIAKLSEEAQRLRAEMGTIKELQAKVDRLNDEIDGLWGKTAKKDKKAGRKGK